MARVNSVRIGERLFTNAPAEELAIAQYAWIYAAMVRTGLNDRLPKLVREGIISAQESGRGAIDPERANQIAQEIILSIYGSGALLDLLAGFFVPLGTEWSEEVASATKEYIGGLKGAGALRSIQDRIVDIVLGFFTNGLVSTLTSPRFSGADPAASQGEPEPQTSGRSTP